MVSLMLRRLTIFLLTPFKDPVDPHLSLYDVDDASTVITLADWYHNVGISIPYVSSIVLKPSIV
jgi:hypothetical protein